MDARYYLAHLPPAVCGLVGRPMLMHPAFYAARLREAGNGPAADWIDGMLLARRQARRDSSTAKATHRPRTPFAAQMRDLPAGSPYVKFTGCAAPYYRPGDGGTCWLNDAGEVETFDRGCFDGVLSSNVCQVEAQVSHDPETTLGVRGENLRVWADGEGLQYELRLACDPVADRIRDMIRHGRITGASVGWNPEHSRSTVRESQYGAGRFRRWTHVDLHDVSLAFRPCFTATSCKAEIVTP